MKEIVSLLKLKVVREKSEEYNFNPINIPKDVVEIIKKMFDIENLAEEIVVLLTLDTKNKITGAFEVSHGSVDVSILHPREVYKRAIMQNASSIIIAHNHPSGNPEPSSNDIRITETLARAGDIIGIELRDHIIIGENQYVSMKERHLL
jgi:DNA repair protein RadC